MKKNLFLFGLAIVLLASLSVLLNVPSVNAAPIHEYISECDIAGPASALDDVEAPAESDQIIDQYDLIQINNMINNKLTCSSSVNTVCLCDVNGDRKCNSKDYKYCKNVLGASSAFSNTGISEYPSETYVAGLNINKEIIKSKIIEGDYSLDGNPNVNIKDSSWFENFYDDYKYMYSKRKYVGTSSWMDINSDNEINGSDRKLISHYRHNLKKAFGQKIIPQTEIYAKIMANEMDLNDDGAINKLDKKIVGNIYKILRRYLKGKIETIDTAIYNFDTADSGINDEDANALKAYYKSISKYYYIFNYDPADVKAKILADDFDLNNDYVINDTDFYIIKDYKKNLNKMKKYSPNDQEFNNAYNLNEEAENQYGLTAAVDESDVLIFIKYYVKLKQNKRYGKITYELADEIPPFIWLKGNKEITLTAGKEYKEPGYRAWDNRDRNLTSEVTVNDGGLDVHAPGTYTITYTVTDGTNSTDVTRAVTITALPDTTAPTISLSGDNPLILNLNDAYSEPGYSANDDIDGDITDQVIVDSSALDTSVVGDYTITYNVSDSAGNAAAEAIRTVTVIEPGTVGQ